MKKMVPTFKRVVKGSHEINLQKRCTENLSLGESKHEKLNRKY